MVEALPGRLRRRLEADPGLAAGWHWSTADDRLAVEAAPEATVTLPGRGLVSRPEQVACTCLLAPRCLHLAAVLRALPAAGTAPAEEAPAAEAATDAAGAAVPRPAQRQAAGEAWRAGAALLEAGVGPRTLSSRASSYGRRTPAKVASLAAAAAHGTYE